MNFKFEYLIPKLALRVKTLLNDLIETNLSASSKIIILCLPFGKVTFCWANILILLRTTSIPLQ